MCLCCSVTQSSPTLCPLMKCSIRLPCPSLSPGGCSNSYSLNWWCHPTILSFIVPFSYCLQSFPESGSFPMNRLFTSDGQSIRDSASVLPMSIQCWFPLRLTGLISLLSKGLSRIFSHTIVKKHKFFSIQLSLWPNSHTHKWLLENHSFDKADICW